MDKAILIMAGGSGSRLWPLSRKRRPKQSHRLFSDVSTFENLLNIIRKHISIDNIYVSVGESQYDYVSLTDVPTNNILLQKKNKNTAPAILYSVNKIVEDMGNCNIAILPSDHLILDEDLYNDVLLEAYDSAELTNTIIAIGTKPLYPSTGFGYIEIKNDKPSLQKVMMFKEKPTKDKAIYYTAGNHLWNTGIYVSQSDILLDSFSKNLPEMYNHIKNQDVFFEYVKSTSFDIGIIEKTKDMYVIVSKHLWVDIGTYEFLDYYLTPDSKGNTIQGDALVFDSNSTSVVSDAGMVVTFGTSDVLIVNTRDVVFVCDKKFLQKIGDLVEKLEKNGGEYLL